MEDLDHKYKENGFKVPQGYFESFDDKVLSRLNKEEPARKWTVTKIRNWWSAAACLVLLVGITYVVSRPRQDTFSTAYLDNVDPVELARYADEVELDDEEFEELIPMATVDSVYRAEILASNSVLTPAELQDLEEEYSPLDEETEI